MLEEYYKYKTNYSEYIIIIKSGNFYEVIDKDALIVNKLFKYKITKLADTIKGTTWYDFIWSEDQDEGFENKNNRENYDGNILSQSGFLIINQTTGEYILANELIEEATYVVKIPDNFDPGQ